MSYDTMNTCAAITVATAIEDMAAETGISIEEARRKLLESSAYECLMDFESGLWAEGPDYFRDYYKRCEKIKNSEFNQKAFRQKQLTAG